MISRRLCAIAAGIGLLCLMQASCRFLPMSVMQRAGVLMPSLENDHVNLAQSVSASTVLNHRLRPSTSLTGKKVLTREDCRGLALSNSLEIEQARIEEISQQAVEYSNRTKLLPHLLLSGELGERDNEPYSYSEILGQEGSAPDPGSRGTGVNQFATGRERTTWRYVLESRWSPTDAALAYYLSKSSHNDKQKQHYVRVRIAQKLIGIVDSSFVRLLALQQVLPMAQRLVGIRRDVFARLENLFGKNLAAVEDYHKAKDKLIKAERLLVALGNEAATQRNLLASAMYLSPEYSVDGGFCVAGDLAAPDFCDEIGSMEMTAVRNRPEAYKAGLDHINSVNDLQRTMIKYFPKVTGYWRYTRDNDKHQYNRDWKDIGVMVYFDLVDWCVNFWERRATRMITEKTHREIAVVALGVTSQVRGSAIKYFDALDQLRAARSSAASSEKVIGIQRQRAARDAQQKLAVREAEGDLLRERIDVIRAIGEAQAFLAELQSAMGTNYNEPLAH